MTEEFSAAAAAFPAPYRLLVRETAASTNDEVKILGQAGTPSGLVLLALEQTAGRGRRGAAWHAPVGEALAFSILIRPEEPQALWPRLALASGLAVAEAVEVFGVQAGIKWPNDVWIRGKKVAGILVEAGRDFAVVGIGMNVNSLTFPPEIAEIATSLDAETSQKHRRAEVLSTILSRFAVRSRQIGSEFPEMLAAVRERCVLTGNLVSLSTSSGPRQGIVEGIAPGGELLLRSDHGLEKLLQADEVRILR